MDAKDSSLLRSVLAHCIVYQGREYPISVASITPEGQVTIKPFTAEVHSTVFISGRVTLTPVIDPATATYCWSVDRA